MCLLEAYENTAVLLLTADLTELRARMGGRNSTKKPLPYIKHRLGFTKYQMPRVTELLVEAGVIDENGDLTE